MVVGQNDNADLPANYNPQAPGEPNPELQQHPVPPVPGVHKETRDHHQGSGVTEGTGHTGGGGGRDHH